MIESKKKYIKSDLKVSVNPKKFARCDECSTALDSKGECLVFHKELKDTKNIRKSDLKLGMVLLYTIFIFN